MKVVGKGASGRIGRFMADELEKSGQQVTSIDIIPRMAGRALWTSRFDRLRTQAL